RRRVVKRKVEAMTAGLAHAAIPNRVGETEGAVKLLALGLAGADAERLLVILAVVDISQVQLDLASEEELVRGREKCHRSTGNGFHNPQPVARAHRHRVLVRRSAKSIFLPAASHVAPDHLLRL